MAIFKQVSIPVILALTACNAANTDPENAGLTQSHQSIVSDYKNISHMPAEALLALPSDTIRLFDTRKQTEFDVSHITGAQWIDPESSPEEFLLQIEEDLSGKSFIFYCSVGRRSSALADRVHADLKRRGANVYNLEKGIFGWHNKSLPLVNAKGPTDAVHPYNAFWGRQINRRDKISYAP